MVLDDVDVRGSRVGENGRDAEDPIFGFVLLLRIITEGSSK